MDDDFNAANGIWRCYINGWKDGDVYLEQVVSKAVLKRSPAASLLLRIFGIICENKRDISIQH